MGGPNGDRILATLLSALVQGSPIVGEFYQADLVQTGYDPIAGYRLTAEERRQAALLAMFPALIPVTPVYRSGTWIDDIATLPTGGPGRWVEATLLDNPAARAYQAKVTGASEGFEYLVKNRFGEHKFDGFARIDGTLALIDAKKDYSFLVDKHGQLRDWRTRLSLRMWPTHESICGSRMACLSSTRSAIREPRPIGNSCSTPREQRARSTASGSCHE